MRKLLVTLFASFALCAPALADAPDPDENLGALTSYAILLIDNWDQGDHSSDPNMDGVAKQTRVGLANAINRGDLAATVEFLAEIILP
jgi:hypothetical protein